MNYAPIILFVYNRPWHTRQTLEALVENELADQSELFIYADGPKENASEEQLKNIQEVREIIRENKWCKEVHIIEFGKNKGLADSIISGVTEIVNQFGKVIVLEDDIVSGYHFLSYMNESLARYEHNDNVMQVSGFAFELDFPQKNTCYFIPLTTTWGWATWQRAWTEIDFSASGYEALHTDHKLRSQFNLADSYDYSTMLFQQMEKKTIDSWGIRYWWSVFKSGGIVLHPDHSMVQNIGFDNSGVHCANESIADFCNWDSHYKIKIFPDKIKHESLYFKALQKFLKAEKQSAKTSLMIFAKRKVKDLLSRFKMTNLNK